MELVSNVNIVCPECLYILFNLFQVTLQSNESDLDDTYRLPVGIRTLSWDNTTFQINNRNVYMRGFGKHEDSDVSKYFSSLL